MATLLNERDKALQAATYRNKLTTVTVTSSTGSFKTAKNGGATAPSNVVLTAIPNNVYTAAATYTWHYALSATPSTWVSLGTGITQTVTSAAFIAALAASSSQIQYRCTVSEPLLDTAYGYFTVLYTLEPSEAITVSLTRTNAVLNSDSAGTITSYANTGTTITVSRGNTQLNYSAIAGVANTFSVSIDATQAAGRTAGTTSNNTTSWTFSGITALSTDGAKVVFIVTVYDASGNAVSPTIGREIVYNKVGSGSAGPRGQSARTCYIVTNSNIVPITPTSAVGDAAPTGWSFSPTSTLTSGQYMYQSDGILTGTIGDVAQATVIGSISGTLLTISSITSGTPAIGMYLSGGTIPANTYIVTGSGLTWTLNQSVTQTSVSILIATPTTIAWNPPYLSNLKVGSLEAISANMGTLTTGTLTAGTTFAGNLSAATGTFTGALSGATGEFAGTLRAGVLDLATFAGISYTFSSPGDADKTVPSGKSSMRVTLVGAGGGGGAGASRSIRYSGAGGGAGGLITQVFSGLTPGAVISVAIGAGGIGAGAFDPGTGQQVGASGTAGGSTSVYYNGSLYATATGGGGGGGARNDGNIPQGGASGGVGGAAGQNGISSTYTFEGSTSYGVSSGGKGGGSGYGTGGNGGIANSGTPATVGGSGAGGGGGGLNWSNNNAGMTSAAGGPGYAIIEFFDPNTVVLQTAFDVLKAALSRQGIAIT